MKKLSLVSVGTFLERVTFILMGAGLFGPRWLLIPMGVAASVTAIFSLFGAKRSRGENLRRAH